MEFKRDAFWRRYLSPLCSLPFPFCMTFFFAFVFFSVSIASIKELRIGSATDAFTQCPEVYVESRCFAIIHGDDFSTLDLVFSTEKECLHWIVGLRYILAKKSGKSA